jgi:hypothetical protein
MCQPFDIQQIGSRIFGILYFCTFSAVTNDSRMVRRGTAAGVSLVVFHPKDSCLAGAGLWP